MNKEELWKKFCEKNPNFLIDGYHHTFTSKGVKQLFDQTWSTAFDCGLLVSKQLNKTNDSNSVVSDIFDSIFKNKK